MSFTPTASKPVAPLPIAAVTVDIDGTLVRERPGAAAGHPSLYGNPVLSCIAAVAATEQGRPVAAIRQALRRYIDDTIWWDYPDVVAVAGASDRVWADIVRLHAETLEPVPEVAEMVRMLHGAGIPLYIMSNNPVVGCLLKLQVAGLATRHGSDYFQAIYGSNNCRGQKHDVAMWRRCLEQLAVPAAAVAHVGDHPQEDGAVPAAAGVGHRLLLRQSSLAEPPTASQGAAIDRARQVYDYVRKHGGFAA